MPNQTARRTRTSRMRFSRCQTVASRRARKSTWSTSAHSTAVNRFVTKFLRDSQKLVVLGDAVGPAERAGFDLARIRRHGNVRNRGVLGFARTMTDDRGVVMLHRQLNCVERFG